MSIKKAGEMDFSRGLESVQTSGMAKSKKTGHLPGTQGGMALLPGQGKPDSALDKLLRRESHEERFMQHEPEIEDPSVLDPNRWASTALEVQEIFQNNVQSSEAKALISEEKDLNDALRSALYALQKG